MIVAVRYDRCSTDEDRQDVRGHLAGLRALAEARGWSAPDGDEFFDYLTGDPGRRKPGDPPGLRRALERLGELGARGVLVIRDATRLVRSPIELLHLVARVQATGAAIVSREDGADLDTTTDHGELMIFLRGWLGRMQLKFIRRMTAGAINDRKRQLAERGEFLVTGKNSKRRGQVITSLGRPRADAAKLDRGAELVRGGVSIKKAAGLAGVGFGTLHAHLKAQSKKEG
jgi:DNA invertase Pin-like site-specific DNA recombinase